MTSAHASDAVRIHAAVPFRTRIRLLNAVPFPSLSMTRKPAFPLVRKGETGTLSNSMSGRCADRERVPMYIMSERVSRPARAAA
jgi:hypothetical protein